MTDTETRAPASSDTSPAERAASRAAAARGAPLVRVIGRRLLEIVLVLWGAATITFIAVKSIPGDPVDIISGGENIVDAAQRALITAQYGLDQPILVQYATYVGRAFVGDFGDSYVFRAPVLEVIGNAAVPTLQLAGSAFVLGIALALAAALSTSGRRPVLRWLASGVELLLLSTPVYWVGIVLLVVFSFGLGWFPVTGADGPASLVLPAIALALPIAAVLSQVLRDGVESALTQPFALTVRSRGVGEGALRARHALRHALLAASTVSGNVLGGLLGGSILTETVFGRPGVGQITLLGIGSRDMPLILGLVVLSALVYSVVNLLIDLGYRVIDPRVRDGATA
ncbi:ABC transporter permease [Microbacterium betulae]|uniref:ABC transporter permease n=1 Tax=Microbacterium betulae TaxID=2981139 RepID=A0AA97FIT3_9MICO|nr:ABC transporter permease [Microbacterium sp. AB]WOF23045.1 ABC transporter permease [Microbacterium sp. AB]